jgi:broad specificity phosphatase PhoE
LRVDLILVRHGVTDWNERGRLMGRSDVELNARGAAQAQAAADAVRSVAVRSIFASPQRRAQQTAEFIAGPHQLVVRTEAALAEVWLGRWQGLTWNDARNDPDVARYLADPMYQSDALEPAAAVHERVVGFVEALRSAADETVVVVSHGDPLRILLAHYLEMPLASYRRLEVAPGSVSLLRFGPDASVRAVLLNWRPQRGSDQLGRPSRSLPP